MLDAPRHEIDDTVLSQAALNAPAPAPSVPARRSTVLPRVEWKGTRPEVLPPSRERFEEVRPLGRGGMGEVVLLKDHDIDRHVALKRLPAGADLDRVLRFTEEIRTVGQLDHPNIAPVHDVGVDEEGRYYFVMKHLQGSTLEDIITKLREGDRATHERFPFPVRIQLFTSVLQAVGYAHGKSLIHRDLKPANIMVGPYGEVTVLDWGLARAAGAAEVPLLGSEASEAGGDAPTRPRTQVGAVLGTPLYMSPEQARGARGGLDARSDVYSLCVLFQELLFLRHYLEGRESLDDILQGVATVTPDLTKLASSPHQPLVPAEMAWFVAKGLEKDPAKRYQSVAEMQAALQGVLCGEIEVRCQRTFLKRVLHETLSTVDAHPVRILAGGAVAATVLLGSLAYTLVSLLS